MDSANPNSIQLSPLLSSNKTADLMQNIQKFFNDLNLVKEQCDEKLRKTLESDEVLYSKSELSFLPALSGQNSTVPSSSVPSSASPSSSSLQPSGTSESEPANFMQSQTSSKNSTPQIMLDETDAFGPKKRSFQEQQQTDHHTTSSQDVDEPNKKKRKTL